MCSHPFCSISLGGKWRDRCRAKCINDMGFMPLIHPHDGATPNSNGLLMEMQKKQVPLHQMSSTVWSFQTVNAGARIWVPYSRARCFLGSLSSVWTISTVHKGFEFDTVHFISSSEQLKPYTENWNCSCLVAIFPATHRVHKQHLTVTCCFLVMSHLHLEMGIRDGLPGRDNWVLGSRQPKGMEEQETRGEKKQKHNGSGKGNFLQIQGKESLSTVAKDGNSCLERKVRLSVVDHIFNPLLERQRWDCHDSGANLGYIVSSRAA